MAQYQQRPSYHQQQRSASPVLSEPSPLSMQSGSRLAFADEEVVLLDPSINSNAYHAPASSSSSSALHLSFPSSVQPDQSYFLVPLAPQTATAVADAAAEPNSTDGGFIPLSHDGAGNFGSMRCSRGSFSSSSPGQFHRSLSRGRGTSSQSLFKNNNNVVAHSPSIASTSGTTDLLWDSSSISTYQYPATEEEEDSSRLSVSSGFGGGDESSTERSPVSLYASFRIPSSSQGQKLTEQALSRLPSMVNMIPSMLASTSTSSFGGAVEMEPTISAIHRRRDRIDKVFESEVGLSTSAASAGLQPLISNRRDFSASSLSLDDGAGWKALLSQLVEGIIGRSSIQASTQTETVHHQEQQRFRSRASSASSTSTFTPTTPHQPYFFSHATPLLLLPQPLSPANTSHSSPKNRTSSNTTGSRESFLDGVLRKLLEVDDESWALLE